MTWQNYLAENKTQFLDELVDFLRIPSISSLPEHAADVRKAGEWVAARMHTAGIENIEVMETGGHPVVYGDWLHAPGQPTVMIYGHFDVQPVDPLELWDSPPFEPTIKDGRIYARGSNDDKGNMLTPIIATEALLRSTGKLPLNVKYFFEGQEEIGSPTLPPFVEANQEKFLCDTVISSDGGQYSDTQPELTIGLRGLAALQIDVRGPDVDVHSGMYGGAIANPIHALVQILDSMRSVDGKILVAGFYDRVRPLTAEDRGHIAAVPHEDAAFTARGMSTPPMANRATARWNASGHAPRWKSTAFGAAFRGLAPRPFCPAKPMPRSPVGWWPIRNRKRSPSCSRPTSTNMYRPVWW